MDKNKRRCKRFVCERILTVGDVEGKILRKYFKVKNLWEVYKIIYGNVPSLRDINRL